MKIKTDCPVTGKLDFRTEKISLNISNHNHEIDPKDVEIMSLQSTLKQNSIAIDKNLRQIFDDTCRRYPSEISSKISFPKVQKNMNNAKKSKYPKIPRSISEFCTNLGLSSSLNKNLKSIIRNEERIIAILFFSDEMIEIIGNQFSEICYDGTFFVVPKLFTQLFIISVKCSNRFLPTFFVLMESRDTQAYELVFRRIKELLPDFSPMISIGDYEIASMASIRRCFPNILSFGCYFHFRQSVLRKLGELNLKNFYIKDKLANQWFDLLFKVGFLPSSKIQSFINKLTSFIAGTAPQQSKIYIFLHYYSRTWLNNLQKINWFDAPYYTNNFSESFNKKLKIVMGSHHANPWKFVGILNEIIEDNKLENLRIKNKISTTRQIDPSKVIRIPYNLKMQLLNDEIDSLNYIKEIFGISEIHQEIERNFIMS